MGRLLQVLAPMTDDVALAGYAYIKAKRKAEAKKEKRQIKEPVPAISKTAEHAAQTFYDLTRKFRRGMWYGRTVSTVAHGNDLEEVADNMEEQRRASADTPPLPELKKEKKLVAGA